MLIKIDVETLIVILGLLFGFNTAYCFSDFDEWITKKVPKDFKTTFTWYLVSRLLKAVHHYMIGIIIMILFYPPHSTISLFVFSTGLGIFLEETDVFISDLKKVVNRIKKLKGGLNNG